MCIAKWLTSAVPLEAEAIDLLVAYFLEILISEDLKR